MRFSIRAKIIVGIITWIMLFTIFINGSIQSLLGDITNRKLAIALQSSLISYKRFEKQTQKILSYESYLIANTPHLKATLNIPYVDKESIIYALSEIDMTGISDSMILVINDQGDLLFNSISPSQEKFNIKYMPGIDVGLSGREYSGYWKFQDDYYAVAISPSIIANQLLGLVIVGLKINDVGFLKSIKDSSGSNVTLHLNSLFFGSSNIKEVVGEEISNTLFEGVNTVNSLRFEKADSKIIEVNVNNKKYFTSLIPMDDTDASLIMYKVENALYENFKSINIMLILGSVVAIAFGLLFSLYISRKISKPILSLISATKYYAQGDFSVRTDIKGNDELSDLTLAVNKMASDLQTGRKDLMDKDAAEKEMRYLAYFDALTGLPNRRYFHERLDKIIEGIENKPHMIAVFFIDIDNFKRINDSLGHDLGDDLLVMFSSRLSDCIRESGVLEESGNVQKNLLVSRLGGDEFTIIIDKLLDKNTVSVIAEHIIEAYVEPFLLAGQEVVVTGSVGISISDMNDVSSEKMMKCADLAMYEAKHSGKNNYRLYSADTKNSSEENLGLEIEMRRAIDNDEFDVHFQPIVDINTSKTIGTEVLTRWNHPAHGVVPPDKFIPVAESIGLINQLGEIILNKACKQFKQWQNNGFELEKLNVNFSAIQFNQLDLFEKVTHILSINHLSPKYLVIEITESLSMSLDQEVVDTLKNFRSLGAQIAIDDFGTGQSNLRYLSLLPLDAIKIDRCFISTICEDLFNSGIVTTILALAESLNLDVVAEGVETQEQLELLKSLGLVHAQGFYFNKPLTAKEFEALIRAEQSS